MELKELLTTSTYKQLSRNNKGWRKTYLAEMPWKEMAIDVDSLVFFHMRKYLDIPYRTPKDETMVCLSFLHNVERSIEWMVEDMVRYSINRFLSLSKFLSSIGVASHRICATGIPPLKEELYQERARKRERLEDAIRALGTNIYAPKMRDKVMSLARRYALCFRDEVRDRVVHEVPSRHVAETDKECAKYRVTMSEDVDVLLFGNKRTIVVKPFVGKPAHFDFIDCESYYVDKGIKSHADFVQVALLIGTDYNKGVRGLGTKRSVEIVNKYRTIERYVATKYDLDDDNAIAFVEGCEEFVKYRTF